MKKLFVFTFVSLVSMLVLASCGRQEMTVFGKLAYDFVIEANSTEISLDFKDKYLPLLESVLEEHDAQLLTADPLTGVFEGEQKECNARAIAACKDFMGRVQNEVGTGSIYAQNGLTVSVVLPATDPSDNMIIYEEALK